MAVKVKVKLSRSKKNDKKFMMTFSAEGEVKKVHFGAKGYSDYTIHKDDARKERYLTRHRKNENWNDPYSAGALSRWILWNKKTVADSFNDYKRRFNFS